MTKIDELLRGRLLVGANVAWNIYGYDFDDEGRFDYNFWRYKVFQRLSEAKANTARVWIFGRGEIFSWTDDGKPYLSNKEAIANNVKMMLDAASNFGIKVIPVFIDFEISLKEDKEKTWGYDLCQKRLKIFDNDGIMDAFIWNVIVPVVQACAGHQSLLAWDICNEAEWLCRDTKGAYEWGE
eukprot:jgi/Botrbrau1/11674/Bobra.0195s0005.1